MNFSRDFIELACNKGVLRFGEFVTKAGRLSPYFFNAGLFNDGASFNQLCDFYARTLLAAELPCDMLFGPAYKGIPLVAGTAMRLAEHGRNLPFSFNRKEAKDHGEGGVLIGAPLAGRVLIVDDVISAGTATRESIALIRSNGATPAGVLIALDRQERGQGVQSAAQEIAAEFGIPVIAIARLEELLALVGERPELAEHRARLAAYRSSHGV